jgi:phage terminase large subunit-like protein
VIEDLFAGFNEIWLVVPEGNGKTCLMAGVALYYADHIELGSVVLGASSRDQCGILLGQAGGFVIRSGLRAPSRSSRRGRFLLQLDGHRRIESLRTGGRIQVFAADDRTGDGILPDLAMVDELHRHRDLSLYRTWAGKLDKRGGALVAISTAGEPGCEFEDARRGLLGDETGRGSYMRVASGRSVIHDHSVPGGGDVEDLTVVKAANPLGALTVESLRIKRARPTMTDAHWRRFTCNQTVRGSDAAVSQVEWDIAATDERPERGTPVWVGLDLGWKHDTTAIVPLWVPEPGCCVLLAPTILVPPRDGTSTPPSAVQDALREVHARYPVHTVVMDPAAGGEQLSEWIETELGARVVTHSNGNRAQALAAQRFYEGLRAEPPTLRHTGDDGLAQHVLNARARVLPHGDVVFDRPTSSRWAPSQDQRVIDALSAALAVHSVAVADAAGDEPAQSVYQTRDLLVL